ncbi:MAG: hypothetical protein ACP5UB_08460 [Candidatus Sumerlaeaceae bacterium]
MSMPSPATSPRHSPLLSALLRWGPPLTLVILAIAAHAVSLGGGFFWDDYSLAQGDLLNRPLAEFWKYPPTIALEEHYWPVTYTGFWLLHKLSGLDPFTFRFANILLHAANVLLVFLLLRQLRIGSAWLGAALFAVHPVHVESVAWIIELKDVLSAFWLLLATVAFVQQNSLQSPALRAVGLIAAGTLYVLAVWSKTVAIGWPVAMGVLLAAYLPDRIKKHDIALTVYVFLGAILLWLDLRVTARVAHATISLSAVERLELVGRTFWWYVAKLIWPVPLLALYPRWQLGGSSFTHFWPSVALFAAAGGATICWFRLPSARPLVAWLVWFVIFLGPTLGIIPHSFMVHSFVADRYLYLASMAPCALAAMGYTYVSKRYAGQRLLRLKLAGFAAVVLTIYFSLSMMHSALYAQPTKLLRHTLAHNPNAANLLVMLGATLAQRGELEESAQCFRKAKTLAPDELAARANLAVISWQLGDVETALEETSAVLGVLPRHSLSWSVYAAALAAKGKTEEAQRAARRALELNPEQQLARKVLQGEITTAPLPKRRKN